MTETVRSIICTFSDIRIFLFHFIQQQTEQEHKIKAALTTIKYVTDGQFAVSGRDVAYNSTNHSYYE